MGLFEKLFGERPTSTEDYFKRGNALVNQVECDREYDRAIAEYTQAIQLDPKWAVAFYNRGVAHTYKGQFDLAIADNTESIRLDPQNKYTYRQMMGELRFMDERKAQELKKVDAMPSRCILFSWIGQDDLREMASSLPEPEQAKVLKSLNPALGFTVQVAGCQAKVLSAPQPLVNKAGAIKCLLEQEEFDEVHLLSDHSAFLNRHYVKWLGCDPIQHSFEVADPTDDTEIFTLVDAELAAVLNVPRRDKLELSVLGHDGHWAERRPEMVAIWRKYGPVLGLHIHQDKAKVSVFPFDGLMPGDPFNRAYVLMDKGPYRGLVPLRVG